MYNTPKGLVARTRLESPPCNSIKNRTFRRRRDIMNMQERGQWRLSLGFARPGKWKRPPAAYDEKVV